MKSFRQYVLVKESNDYGSFSKMQKNVKLCVGRLKMRELRALGESDILHLSPMEKAGSLTAHFIVCTGHGEKDIEYSC